MGRIGVILRNYSTVSRWEFLPAIAVAILIGVFLGAESFQSLLGRNVLLGIAEGLIIFFLLFNTGFMVNCWADFEVDERYKTSLSKAVKEIGRSTLGKIVILHIAMALLLTLHLTIVLGKIELTILVLIGTFFGVGYSVEPFRFKRRGALHAAMAFPVFAMPGMFSYYLVTTLHLHEAFTYVFLTIVVGITAAHYGLVLVSQIEDLPDDREANITTPAVKWGLTPTLGIALGLNIFGSLVLIAAYTYYFATVHVLLLLFMPIFVMGRMVPTKAVFNLHRKAQRLKKEEKILAEIRTQMKNYPLWHASGLFVIMIGSALSLLLKSFGIAAPLL